MLSTPLGALDLQSCAVFYCCAVDHVDDHSLRRIDVHCLERLAAGVCCAITDIVATVTTTTPSRLTTSPSLWRNVRIFDIAIVLHHRGQQSQLGRDFAASSICPPNYRSSESTLSPIVLAQHRSRPDQPDRDKAFRASNLSAPHWTNKRREYLW